MIPTITVFERSPDRGRGLARDMQVRWALEEVGQPYHVRLVSFSEMKQAAHRRLQPFGHIRIDLIFNFDNLRIESLPLR
jgi:glutathione S-transferase